MYGITAVKCHNWHNLLEQELATNGGDLILIGESGTGKTTALDAIQYVVTGGLEAQWNAAANPVHSVTELKERGRSLRDILLRYTDERGNLAPEGPIIAYFGVELTDPDTGDVMALAFGAKLDSHEAHTPSEWWYLRKGQHLRDVGFTADGFLLDKEPFRQANGRDYVFDTGRYRIQLAHEFFPATATLDSGDAREVLRQWAKYLNLGKAYGRLAKADVPKLLQDALPAPDRAIFEEAKRGFAEIATIYARVKQAEANLANLNKVHAELATARLNGQRLSATKLARSMIESRRISSELERLAKSQKAHEEKAAQAEQGKRRIDAQIKAASDLLESLANPAEEALFRDLERLRADLKAAERNLGDLQVKASALKKELEERRAQARKAHEAWVHARDSAMAAILHATQTVAGKVREAMQAMAEALRSDASLADLASLRKRIDVEKNAETTRLVRLEEQQATRAASLEAKTQELVTAIARATAEQDVAPRVSTVAALAAAGSGARALYQCIEVKAGSERDAVLLQEFLGPAVLGAVLPEEASELEATKKRVHKAAPETLVIDVPSLPEAGKLNGILSCIDDARSDSVAVRFLRANFGDVALVDAGHEASPGGRTVWRDGLVLDGNAWHVEVGSELRFLGVAARQAARQARIDALRSELGTVNTELARARKQVTIIQGQRTDLQHAVGDALQHVDEADLSTKVAKVTATKEAESRVDVAHAQQERLVSEHKVRLADMKVNEERFKIATASKDVKDRQLKRVETKTLIDQHRVERDAALSQASVQTEAAKADAVAASKVAESGLGLPERLRAQRDELINKWNVIDPDAYAQEEGFVAADGAEGKDLHMADMNYARSQTRAMDVGDQLVGDLVRQGEDLVFDKVALAVREGRTGLNLDDRIRILAEETKTKRKEQVERTKRIYDAQSIHPIAEMLKRELLGAEAFVDQLNTQLERTLYTGKQFRLSMKQKSEYGPYIRLVRTYSATSPGNLQEWLQATLSDESKTPDQLLEMFDYRTWFTYELRKVREGTEGTLAAGVSNSGGEQAGSHYMLTYAMLAMFYHKHKARVRCVVLDEAFRGVDAKNKMSLYAMAKDIALVALIANTDFEGHTTLPVTVDILMFQKDPESLETFIQNYNRRIRVEA